MTSHLRALPGVLATLILALVATAVSVGCVASLFYEGWGLPLLQAAAYLVPALIVLALSFVALRWPAAGSAMLLTAGVGAGLWWAIVQSRRGIAGREEILLTVLMMVGPIVIVGALLLLEARHRHLLLIGGARLPARWLGRHWRELLVVGVPVAGVAILSAQQLPGLLSRHDDGLRGARIIEGNGVTLVWAPAGPGWNWEAPGAGYPAWDALLRGGTPPVGRCAFLNTDGTALLAAPTGLWRLPTADEIVRSLTRGGTNAGCAWNGRPGPSACDRPPDKETPLWAPDQRPIYYWSAQQADDRTAFAVNYTGGISVLPKTMTGLGFRCVKAVTGAPGAQR